MTSSLTGKLKKYKVQFIHIMDWSTANQRNSQEITEQKNRNKNFNRTSSAALKKHNTWNSTETRTIAARQFPNDLSLGEIFSVCAIHYFHFLIVDFFAVTEYEQHKTLWIICLCSRRLNLLQHLLQKYVNKFRKSRMCPQQIDGCGNVMRCYQGKHDIKMQTTQHKMADFTVTNNEY